jgi:hypothetical protein
MKFLIQQEKADNLKFIYAVFIVFVIVVSLRFYQLDLFPGEWFGDISNVHEYVQQILTGTWPFYFFQSAGPLYHYLIAPIIFALPYQGYLTYKIASVVISLWGILVEYFLVKAVTGNRKIAVLAAAVMGISFWYLIWSRLGNSQILIPILSALAGLLLVLYYQLKKIKYLLLSVVVANLGLITYPHTFILPTAIIGLYFFRSIFKSEFYLKFKEFLLILVISGLCTIPFGLIISAQSGSNFGNSGYVGSKILPVMSMPLPILMQKIWINIEKTALMLHLRGDSVFRVNIANHPQLDFVSGIMFFVGIGWFISRRKYLELGMIIWMICILCLPSISPAISANEIPNANRTVAIIPYVYLLVAAGFGYTYQLLLKTLPKNVALLLFIFIFITFGYLNLHLYFIEYQAGLPDHNLSPGKIIANFIDQNFPKSVKPYIAECCWGQMGEPENKGIFYAFEKPRSFSAIDYLVKSCLDITDYPAVIIGKPDDNTTLQLLQSCHSQGKIIPVYRNNNLVSQILYFPK